MDAFAKFCCIVGQIVVGAVLGFLISKVLFRIEDWVYTKIVILKAKRTLRKTKVLAV